MSISMAMIALMKNKCQQTNDAKFCVHVYLHLCFLQETQREALSCKSNLNLYGVSVWYLCQLNNLQNFLDIGNKRIAIAVLLLQKLHLCTFLTQQ